MIAKEDEKRQQMLEICLHTTCMYGSVIRCQVNHNTENVQQVAAAPYTMFYQLYFQFTEVHWKAER